MSVSKPHLLIVWHSRTGASETLARAAHGDSARLLRASEVEAEDLRAAAGYLFVCPENLASMSGEMKEMFDRCYYPVLGQLEGRPFATIIAAGTDGSGAQRQIDRISKGWRLKRVAEPVIVHTNAATEAEIRAPKTVRKTELARASELGKTLSVGISEGIL